MFPNEYVVREQQKDFLRQAQQDRLAHEANPAASLTHRAGHALLTLGARFAVENASACYTVETHKQVVTVCPA